jgi:hypothetical protein
MFGSRETVKKDSEGSESGWKIICSIVWNNNQKAKKELCWAHAKILSFSLLSFLLLSFLLLSFIIPNKA